MFLIVKFELLIVFNVDVFKHVLESVKNTCFYFLNRMKIYMKT